MKNLIFTLFSAFLLLFTSCQTQNDNDKIPHEINFTDRKGGANNPLEVQIINIIPLQTNPNCLIGRISKVEFFDENVYIQDVFSSKTLFLFDNLGNFVNKTKLGKGPGEFVSPISFTINIDDSIIYVHDQLIDIVSVLTPHLDFIKNIKLNNVRIIGFDHIRADTFLVYHHKPIIKSHKEKRYLTYSMYTEDFSKIKSFNLSVNRNKTPLALQKPVSIIGDKIYFLTPYDYGIYQMIGGVIYRPFSMNFGHLGLTGDQLEEFSGTKIGALTVEGTKIGAIPSLFITNKFIIVRPALKRKPVFLFYSIKSGNIYNLNVCFDGKTLPKCNIWAANNSDEFFGIIEPQDFISYQRHTGKHSNIEVTETDNPLLIKFTLKEPKS